MLLWCDGGTFRARHRGDGARARPHVHDVRLLQPWDEEVRPLAHRRVEDPAEAVEEDGPLPPIHCVQGRIQDAPAKTRGHCDPRNIL